MSTSIVNRFVVAFLVSILWSIPGCAKDSEESTDAVSTARTQTNSTSTPNESKQKKQTFSAFLSEFSALVKAKNWEGLADVTDFPLTIRGELDNEGFVDVDRKKFVELIGGFFEEEVYLTIDDALVASTYRDLMIKPVDKPEIDNNVAEIHGFHFVNNNQQWKLKQITTYVHVVERFKQGE